MNRNVKDKYFVTRIEDGYAQFDIHCFLCESEKEAMSVAAQEAKNNAGSTFGIYRIIGVVRDFERHGNIVPFNKANSKYDA